MREIDVSVVIVSHNTRDILGNCLRSVHERTSGINYEIIVVDNASNDGSVEMVKRDFRSVRLIASVENLGFGQEVFREKVGIAKSNSWDIKIQQIIDLKEQ